MNKKLDTKHELNKIKQTRTDVVEASPIGSASPSPRNKRPTIPFRDSAIDKITKSRTEFGNRRFKEFRFDIPKGSSLKGLQLRFSRITEKKKFIISFWFNKRNEYYILGAYPNIRCKDVEKLCLELAETHQDERGLWIKNPNETRANEKRTITKKDTTMPAGKTINEVGESYCGTDEKEGHRGFLIQRPLSS